MPRSSPNDARFHLGRLPEAIAFDAAEYQRLSERGQVGLLPPLLQSMSVLHLMAGDWDAARREARECMDLVEQGEEAWRERALTARARILAWDGDLEAARSIAAPALARQEAAGDRWEAAIFCALLGFIELSVPDHPAALRYLTRALDHADAMAVVLPTQFRFLGDLVEAAVQAGDLDLADRVLGERLEGPADRLPLPWIEAMAARGRGFLDAARGERDEADPPLRPRHRDLRRRACRCRSNARGPCWLAARCIGGRTIDARPGTT